MANSPDAVFQHILYSCFAEKTKEEERFVREHVLIRILSGNLFINTVFNNYTFRSGDSVLLKRNQLIRATKVPTPTDEFKSVSVFFEQRTLRNFAWENKIQPSDAYVGESILILNANPLYDSYTSSLAAYQQESSNDGLTALKIKEALMLMMLINKETAACLFDFFEPRKIDLEEYMNNHFTFNVTIDRLAYLTGRSLATFKRDFTRIFNTSPNKWLQERRLKEAYFLIKEKRRKVSEVYLEVGFEDLSHFSFAFKNTFGKSPSLI